MYICLYTQYVCVFIYIYTLLRKMDKPTTCLVFLPINIMVASAESCYEVWEHLEASAKTSVD